MEAAAQYPPRRFPDAAQRWLHPLAAAQSRPGRLVLAVAGGFALGGAVAVVLLLTSHRLMSSLQFVPSSFISVVRQAPSHVLVTNSQPEDTWAGPRISGSAEVLLAPRSGWLAVGVLPANARLEVVGRDPTGTWIAIAFPPGSGLTGWVPASSVSGLKSVRALPVAPETPLAQK